MRAQAVPPTYNDCPQLDVLVVPGGPGQQQLMEDDVARDFLRKQAAGARYVSSACTGALVLGAAGLLKGYRATTHWLSLPLLSLLGATPVSKQAERRRTCENIAQCVATTA